jgi:hypothetical protein
MKESLDEARQELKRVDHSIYVSLKYTRTVDMFKRILERLINACEFTMDALLKYAKQKKKLKELPTFSGMKYDMVLKLFNDDPKLVEYIGFYALLKKINRAAYTSAREFRRHVTMTADVEGQQIAIKIEQMHEYNNKVKEFIDYVELLTVGEKAA